jgi:hypothetical protein
VANVKQNQSRRVLRLLSPFCYDARILHERRDVRQQLKNAKPDTDQHRNLLHREKELSRRIRRVIKRIRLGRRSKRLSHTYLLLQNDVLTLQGQQTSDHVNTIADHHQLVANTFRTTFDDPPPLIEQTFIRLITAIDPPHITHSTLRRGNSGFVGGFHTYSRYALRA